MPDFPIMLRVRDQRCLIVGGGAVALRRAKTLLAAGAGVTVIAPTVAPELAALAITVMPRGFVDEDLAGAYLVVVATDDVALNDRIAALCHEKRILLNRADRPEAGDFSVPAHAHHGPITLSVHTDGISAAAAAVIRRQLSECLDPAWPVLLDVVAPYRRLIQEKFDRTHAAARLERLAALTDETAMAILQQHGIPALRRRCEELLAQPLPQTGVEKDR